jgi:murein DD-endopeptidase MepM/ murein hydrolase activator NlpD
MIRRLLLILAVLVSTPAAAQDSSYVVKPGETLNGIANRAGVSREQIIAANKLKPPYPLRAGQKLAIPGASGSDEGKPAQRTIAARQASGGSLAQASSYVVQPGDSLGSIALRAEIPRILIAEANRLAEPYNVRVGQQLLLPRTRRHTVAAGDTGFSISYKYAVPWEQIAIANGIETGAALPAGKVLLIPTVIPSVIPQQDSNPVAAKSAASTKPATSQFAWPLAGPIRRGFLARGGSDIHDGIDITAERGAAARAIAAGKVIFARKDPDQFGNLVVVDHGDGWHSAYGSLEKITVKQGDSVGKGERVGLVGATSITRKTELHFELRKAGLPVNPLDHLPTRP